MSVFDDFKAGDSVVHKGRMGPGIVLEKTPELVVVEFDESKSVGKYDRAWFRIHPHLLERKVSP